MKTLETGAWRPPITHELKCWPEFFESLMDDSKTFEFRKNDRDFRRGDVAWLREWDPSKREYTGRFIQRFIGYVLDLGDGNVVFSLLVVI